MTKTALKKRRSAIISRLSDLSRDGWSAAWHWEWKPLETELRRIDEVLSAR